MYVTQVECFWRAVIVVHEVQYIELLLNITSQVCTVDLVYLPHMSTFPQRRCFYIIVDVQLNAASGTERKVYRLHWAKLELEYEFSNCRLA